MKFAKIWQEFLAVIAVLGLLAHILFRFILPEFSVLPLEVVMWLSIAPLTFQVARKALKNDLGADILAAIALLTSLILEQYLAGTLIVLMLAGGQTLERYAIRKASSLLETLAKRIPRIAHRKRGTHIKDVSLADIIIGDLIVVFPHETVPVDGIVHSGHGSMDESYLTGEPYRVDKAPGALVSSGAINGETALVIKATKLVKDSRYATIMAVMQEAEQRRPKLRRLGDQMGAIFTPIALLVACITWAATGDAMRFLAVLVIATPCPLLIAIPITIISAISLAAKRGIIIRDPVILERLPTCHTAIFDKTGTLTYGKPVVTEILSKAPFKQNDLLRAAASLERYSKHPLAEAIIAEAARRNIALTQASEVSEKPGQGLFGVIKGRRWHLTSRHKIAQRWPKLLRYLPPIATGLECVLLFENKYAGVFRLHDAPRAEGKSFIGHLTPAHQISKVILLSGDRASEVEYLASVLGIKETYSSQSPEQKIEIVRRETALTPTLFMGDGINDAPALTAATVGIAFGQHNSITSQAAGAVILENTLGKVDELLHISLALRRIAMQSAIGGMALSVIGMVCAAAGYLSPIEGALAQEAIDVLAITNALRLAWRPRIAIDMRR